MVELELATAPVDVCTNPSHAHGHNEVNELWQNCSFRQALHEAICKLFPVQVLPNEHHLAALLFAWLPSTFLRIGKEHVDCLIHKLLLHALHGQDALGAEKVNT